MAGRPAARVVPRRLGSARLEPWTPYLSQNIAPPLVRLGSLPVTLLAFRAASAASAVAISLVFAAARSLSLTFPSLLSSFRCSSSRSDRSSSLSYSAGS
eukprot:1259855-Prymnesium_polylepis.1